MEIGQNFTGVLEVLGRLPTSVHVVVTSPLHQIPQLFVLLARIEDSFDFSFLIVWVLGGYCRWCITRLMIGDGTDVSIE
jgi:hypothetical protein